MMIRHRRARGAVVLGALVTAVILGMATAPAWAGNVKIIIGGGGGFYSGSYSKPYRGYYSNYPSYRGFPYQRRQHIPSFPQKVIIPHRGKVLVVPPATHPYAAYPYVAGPRWIPGHWTQRWVPQVSAIHVWRPPHYSAEGYWVGGYYEPRTTQIGYYQQVWVDGYFAR